MIRRGRKKLAALLLSLCIAVGGLGGLLWHQSHQPGRVQILQVGGEAIYANEAMVYLQLLRAEYENMGTKNVWELDMIGLDPVQTALDRVMESIIRVKVTQAMVGSLTNAENHRIQEKTKLLQEQLGEAFLEEQQLEYADLEQIVRENYKAYRYEQDAKFLAGSNEPEIQKKLEEAFGVYDRLDQGSYLQKAMIVPLTLYTGEWVEGEWISYSDVQKAMIYEEAVALREESATQSSFVLFAKENGDSWTVEGNPVFEQGAIRHENGSSGYIYRGQTETGVATAIFNAKPGELTDVIETKYGYCIIKVIFCQKAEEKDYAEYMQQLTQSRENYRIGLLDVLKKQRLEQEWQRLEQETMIERWDERWEKYAGKYMRALP